MIDLSSSDWSEHRPTHPIPVKNGWVQNWFSNLVDSPFELDGIVWRSVENYYQAMKSDDEKVRMKIASLMPNKAKRAGRNISPIVPNWEKVKVNVMLNALRAKFSIPEWREKLLATKHEVIIEWNNWGDTIWGVKTSTNKGQNLLGKCLMQVRTEIQQGKL